MSHHSSDMDDLRQRLMGSASDQVQRQSHIDRLFKQLGATGAYPHGVLTKTDQGGLKIGVVSDDEKIILAFGKEVAWIGFNPSDARALAKSLIDHADTVEREQERRGKL